MVPGDRGGRARVGLEGTGGRNYKVAGGISGGDLLIILTVVMVSWVHTYAQTYQMYILNMCSL